jgi:hypothetical protein
MRTSFACSAPVTPWRMSATVALPVPFSPTRSTGVLTMASFLTCCTSFLICGLLPTIRPSMSAGLRPASAWAEARCAWISRNSTPRLQGRDQLVHPERLLEVVEGAELERLDRALGARVRRHDDRDVVGVVGLELLQERDPVHRLHVDVGEHHVELLGLVARQTLLAVGRERGREACRLDDRLQHFMNRNQVVDDEDGGHD